MTKSSFTASEEEEQSDEVDDDSLEHDDETLELQQLSLDGDELDVIVSFLRTILVESSFLVVNSTGI